MPRHLRPWWWIPVLFLALQWQGVEGFRDGILIGPGQWVSDFLVTYWPNARYLVQEAEVLGRFPQWRAFLFSGTPAVGDPQTGLGYPAVVLYRLLPLPAAFHLSLLLHVMLGSWGMAWVARLRGASPAGQVLAAGAFALFPRVYGHWAMGHISLVYALAWAPWVWAGLHGWRGPRGGWWATVAGVALGMQLSQHAQIALYTLSTALLWPLLEPRGWRPWLARGLRLAAWSAAVALGVAAGVLFPMVHHGAWWARSRGLSPANLAQGTASPVDYLGLLLPNYGGHPNTLLYLGLPLGLLLLAALERPEARRKGLALLAMLAYAGLPALPAVAHALRLVPLFNQVRGPARIWTVGFLWALLLAVEGLEAWSRHDRWPRRWLRWGAPLVVAAFTLALGLRLVFGLTSTPWWGLAATAAAAWWGWGMLLPRLSPRLRTGLLVALPLLDLALMSHSLVETRPLASFFTRLEWQEPARWLQRAASTGEPFRTYSPTYTLPQHIAVRFGLEMADGVDPLYSDLYDRLMQQAAGVPRPRYSVTVPYLHDGESTPLIYANQGFRPNPCLLGLLNVRYLLAPYPLPEDPELVLRQRWGDVHLYENRCWQPRAFWRYRVVRVASPEEALERLGQVDVRRVAVVEGPQAAALAGPAGVPGRVTWLERQADTWRLHVQTPVPGFLVLSLPWHPDWKAYLDGEPVPLQRAYVALSGLWVPAGEHVLELRFRCPGYSLGLGVSLATWGLAGLVGLRVLWGTRSRGRARA